MSEHTKGKLVISPRYDDGSVHLHCGKNRDYICSVQIEQIGGGAIASVMEIERVANAHHLVKCWNCHDDLVAALEFAAAPEAPYSRNQLEFANRIIEAIHNKAKEALGKAKED